MTEFAPYRCQTGATIAQLTQRAPRPASDDVSGRHVDLPLSTSGHAYHGAGG
jgi:hypothetical protein